MPFSSAQKLHISFCLQPGASLPIQTYTLFCVVCFFMYIVKMPLTTPDWPERLLMIALCCSSSLSATTVEKSELPTLKSYMNSATGSSSYFRRIICSPVCGVVIISNPSSARTRPYRAEGTRATTSCHWKIGYETSIPCHVFVKSHTGSIIYTKLFGSYKSQRFAILLQPVFPVL